MKFLPIFLLAVLMLSLVPVVSATEWGAAREMTVKNFVSLGIEKIPGMVASKVQLYYNWISIAFIFLLGAISSKSYTRFFAVLIPVFAALFIWMGWLRSADPVSTWGIVVACGLIGVITYMKGSVRDKTGTSGPGSLIITIVFFLIILQTCVGVINITQVWGGSNAAPTDQAAMNYNVDLSKSIPVTTGTGGFWSDIMTTGTLIGDMVGATIKLLITIVVSLALFSVVINSIFPFIVESGPIGVVMLGLIQLAIYLAYVIFFVQLFSKASPDAVGV
jgi:hypothetical protein